MESIQQSYRGLSVLVDVNWDRLFYMGTIILALGAGSYFGALLLSV